ncbi:hypothetical protein Pfo_015310, partial [Paulownia fortunei]
PSHHSLILLLPPPSLLPSPLPPNLPSRRTIFSFSSFLPPPFPPPTLFYPPPPLLPRPPPSLPPSLPDPPPTLIPPPPPFPHPSSPINRRPSFFLSLSNPTKKLVYADADEVFVPHFTKVDVVAMKKQQQFVAFDTISQSLEKYAQWVLFCTFCLLCSDDIIDKLSELV